MKEVISNTCIESLRCTAPTVDVFTSHLIRHYNASALKGRLKLWLRALSSVWIQQRHRIPTTIFYIFYSSSLSDTRLFRKMHWWIKELRRSRYFKHNWFIRPSEGRRWREENELGLTCTFNYCCQGVCVALLGKANQTITHSSYLEDPQNEL